MEDASFFRDPLIGRSLKGFTIREKLGQGGMGAVYTAEQALLDREVVIKVLLANTGGDVGRRNRFIFEAQIACRLDHPYMAQIFDFGAEPDGLLWIAMQRVRGRSLEALLHEEGPLSLNHLLELLDRICDVLNAAHRIDIVHRDIKPANVMVTEEAGKLIPRLLDFGIARLRSGDGRLPDLRTVGAMGTPHYMAPEQFRDAASVDARADIYALGVLTYQVLTGRLPFAGQDIAQLAYAHVHVPVPSLGEPFAAELDEVVAKAMAKDPDGRFGTTLDFYSAFEAASRATHRHSDSGQQTSQTIAAGAPVGTAPAHEGSTLSAPPPSADDELERLLFDPARGRLSEDEVERAYEWVRLQDGSSPLTPFADLSDRSRREISVPTLLRLAAQVFDGKPVPHTIFTAELLQELVTKEILASPARTRLVTALLDHAIGHGTPRVRMSDLASATGLADDLLVTLANLERVGVCSVTCEPTQLPLPLPIERYVEIASAPLWDYLVMWRIVDPRSDLSDVTATLVGRVKTSPHLRGAAVFAAVQLARFGATELFRSILAQAASAPDGILAREILAALFDSDDAQFETPSVDIVANLFGPESTWIRRAMVDASEALFARGRFEASRRVIAASLVRAEGDLLLEVALRNQLALLYKNMDRWKDALSESDWCSSRLGDEALGEFTARVLINRGSILYDLGDRVTAFEHFKKALHASEDRPDSEEAAAARNNLGIYYLYHDELDEAQRILREGLESLRHDSITAAYLETNLGLAILTRSLFGTSQLEDAETHFKRAMDRFDASGHRQGLSYTLGNLGACHLAAGRCAEATCCFRQVKSIAREIGEVWTSYGADANLALCALLEGDKDRAWHDANSAIEAARANGDPKGVADAALIAARAGLDGATVEGPGYAHLVPVEELLESAANTFGRIDQRLGAAMALFGLAEVHRVRGDEARASRFEQSGRERLEQTPFSTAPARLRALPWQSLLLKELF